MDTKRFKTNGKERKKNHETTDWRSVSTTANKAEFTVLLIGNY